jgi:hypothetical protein
MSSKKLISLFVVLTIICVPSFAAKPPKDPPLPAVESPEVFSVKIDYINGFIIAEGTNLSPESAAATISGVPLSIDEASSDTILLFPFSTEVSAAVDELGNYVLNISTDGGNFTLSAFIPFALVSAPEPPPPGLDCPCSPEWDDKSTAASPIGFSGLTPYCSQDFANFVTVQFYDVPTLNYWVLWTDWDGASSSGSCELYIDGPNRSLDTEAQFVACAAYLKNIVTVWGNQGNTCLF